MNEAGEKESATGGELLVVVELEHEQRASPSWSHLMNLLDE